SARLNGENIRFDGLPDGLKSIITWVADLSLRLEAIPWKVEQDIFAQPIILFLDEVDIHLHPKWQRRILPAIQRLLPNAQVFVSTHSPFVVGSVEDAWVYVLPEPHGGPTSGVVEAIPSGAGKSYRLILEEVFGLTGEFDVETEALFSDFYHLREQFLKAPVTPDALLAAARALAARGDEATLIVSRELRQVSRITGRELSLA
ncbi:MAG TPA: AAA family ATPase, partial [Lamprocystis sp. (in: g-proteobacteria)]|nr:AAA family ATPase [Lamprocystis sp. (in: g-proteobacteria)]